MELYDSSGESGGASVTVVLNVLFSGAQIAEDIALG